MDAPSVIATGAFVLLILSILGGGITFEKIEIPRIPTVIRLIAGVLGLVLLLAAAYLWLERQGETPPVTTTPPPNSQSPKATTPSFLPTTVQWANNPSLITAQSTSSGLISLSSRFEFTATAKSVTALANADQVMMIYGLGQRLTSSGIELVADSCFLAVTRGPVSHSFELTGGLLEVFNVTVEADAIQWASNKTDQLSRDDGCKKVDVWVGQDILQTSQAIPTSVPTVLTFPPTLTSTSNLTATSEPSVAMTETLIPPQTATPIASATPTFVWRNNPKLPRHRMFIPE